MDIPELVYEPTVRAALAEDIGPGDITTLACIPEDATATARRCSPKARRHRRAGCGRARLSAAGPECPLAAARCRRRAIGNTPTPIAQVSGNARALLTAERVALNFLQRLSGVATLTARMSPRRRDRRAHRRHAQDDAWPARPGKVRRACRRRHQPPPRPVRLRTDQGQPYSGRRRHRARRRRRAERRAAHDEDRSRGRHARAGRGGARAGADIILLDNMDTGRRCARP